jgi:hypothetical protein
MKFALFTLRGGVWKRSGTYASIKRAETICRAIIKNGGVAKIQSV